MENTTAVRIPVAESHEGRYTYWLDSSDRYIYQREEHSKRWIGWFCSEPAWERTLSKCDWITLLANLAEVN